MREKSPIHVLSNKYQSLVKFIYYLFWGEHTHGQTHIQTQTSIPSIVPALDTNHILNTLSFWRYKIKMLSQKSLKTLTQKENMNGKHGVLNLYFYENFQEKYELETVYRLQNIFLRTYKLWQYVLAIFDLMWWEQN